MAKAKKTDTAGKKKTEQAKSPDIQSAPAINTAHAAESAAKLVAAKVAVGTASATGGRESSGFKNLKDSLANPTSNTVANFLDKSAGPGQKKSSLPHYGGKQVGRNQTFGADVSRSSVPRRTGGG
jgi:hypothetical protein